MGSQHHGHFFVYDMMEGRSIKVPINHASEITNMKVCICIDLKFYVCTENEVLFHCQFFSLLQNFSVSPDGRIIAALGRFGHIHLITAQSKEWIGSLKMNADVKAISFNKDGSRLYSHGGNYFIFLLLYMFSFYLCSISAPL